MSEIELVVVCVCGFLLEVFERFVIFDYLCVRVVLLMWCVWSDLWSG